jgi:hypothetical protein
MNSIVRTEFTYTIRKATAIRSAESDIKSNFDASFPKQHKISTTPTKKDLSNSLSKKPAREVERRISSGPDQEDITPIQNPAPETAAGGLSSPQMGSGI